MQYIGLLYRPHGERKGRISPNPSVASLLRRCRNRSSEQFVDFGLPPNFALGTIVIPRRARYAPQCHMIGRRRRPAHDTSSPLPGHTPFRHEASAQAIANALRLSQRAYAYLRAMSCACTCCGRASIVTSSHLLGSWLRANMQRSCCIAASRCRRWVQGKQLR